MKIFCSRLDVEERATLGLRSAACKFIWVLNRVVIWKEGIDRERPCVEYYDPRHAEILVRQLKLQADSKGVATPVVKQKAPCG